MPERTIRSTLIALAALAAAVLTSAALAQTEPAAEAAPQAETMEWDQVQATSIARQLADAVKDLRAAFRREGPPGREQMQSRAHHQMRDDLRMIRNETAFLARELEAGKGRDETTPAFRRIGMLVRDAQRLAPRLFIQEPVQQKIDVARTYWDQLQPYYGETPPE
ncbi:MAG: hypothetical protein JSU66_13780 [Deltaproteobacteria bacterium]|nr:MAG: hypothetical protein JSU66_13780 [Deltaproteobacteria bacterium]